MKNKIRISKQLIITLSILNFCITIFTLVVGYAIYAIAIEANWVTWEKLGQNWPYLHLFDWIWFFLVLVLGFFLSIFLGMRLSQRFVTPIESMAIATRKISQGDLTARVTNYDDVNTEISELIDHFNDMAHKLEVSIKNAHVWNAAIAHELRTPVTILQGRLQGMVDGVFEPTPALMKNLLNQTEGLSYLVEDLRTLSLIENQQLKLNIEPTNFQISVTKIASMFSEKLTNAQITIHSEISDDLIYCDSRRMEQVLIALIDNVIRYANAGILSITSSVDRHIWTLVLKDEGPGIPIEFQQELFKPFFRIEDSRNKAFGGTGLGLAVVNAIIIAHHGTIQYENRNSKSVFTIRINFE
ncbi:two-component sensor histidine kinase AdeS [Acinetobacter baumannii]|uniref:two-component sensor histidine kinase AdeS n=1 Tax=Acinetobacter baumannii TaxID=470 RepID=UPI003891206E